MSMKAEAPLESVAANGSSMDERQFDHPAFGAISVSRWTSNHPVRLCGSDLGHRSGLTVRLSQASIKRHLSRDWHHNTDPVVEFTLSMSQWARLVSSIGIGEGVPVTLTAYREGAFRGVPPIAAPELSKKEVHGAEAEQMVAQAVQKLSDEIASLGSMIDSGKLGKQALREVHRSLSIAVGNLPGNLKYVTDRFASSAEAVIADAKTEIEAHVAAVVMQTGLQSLKNHVPMLKDGDA